MSYRPLACLALAALGGCLPLDGPQKTAQVSSQFFEPSTPGRVSPSPLPAADDSICVRVDYVGRKVLAQNPHAGLKPQFATIQAKEPEVFHVDQRVVYITDGFVKLLSSEADLAAVLAYELGRMVAEREARVKHELRQAEPRPPIQVPIGNAGHGSGGEIAATAEMARYERQRKEHREASGRPNPDNLARDYLEKAGYQRADFDRVQPLLQAAARNGTLEGQIKGMAAPGALGAVSPRRA